MGTRTAIFREMSNNEFIGVYVQLDGYLECQGKILNEYYKNDEIIEVIKNMRPLSVLGEQPQIMYFEPSDKNAIKKNEKGLPLYTKTNIPNNVPRYEYFKANSWEEIRTFDYLTYNENHEVQGFHSQNGFKAIRGSDNNGYIYVQDINGIWYVSYSKYEGAMSRFRPLKKEIEALSNRRWGIYNT